MATLAAPVRALVTSILMVGCSAPSRSRPPEPPPADRTQDRSIARHDAEAMVHAGQFDPTAGGTFVPCDGPRGQCWRPTENPTAPHAEHAAEHRAAADAERKAAGWPRSAEEVLCKGIPAEVRGVNPLDGVEIGGVSALTDADSSAAVRKLRGARVTLRSVRDPAAFQQRIDCHVEYVSSRLKEYPGRETCPLVVPGLVARVYAGGDGTVLELLAPDERGAAEALHRAQAMARTR
jgi:hypothetical protein